MRRSLLRGTTLQHLTPVSSFSETSAQFAMTQFYESGTARRAGEGRSATKKLDDQGMNFVAADRFRQTRSACGGKTRQFFSSQREVLGVKLSIPQKSQ